MAECGTEEQELVRVPGLPGLVRSVIGTAVTTAVTTAVGTARAAARLDPAALVGSLADLPTALSALAGLPAVIASVTSLVGSVERAVGDVVPRVEGVLAAVEAIPQRVDAVLGSVEAIPPQVVGLLGTVEEVVASAEGVVAGVDPVLAGADRAIAGAEKAISGGRRVVTRADALVGAIDGPVDALVPVLTLLGSLEVDLLTRLGALVAGLEPLLAQAGRLDPAQVAAVAGSVPELLDTVDDEVLPALRALHGIVPAVEALNHDVERLRQVVGDLGSIVGGLPGAGRLLRRGGERAESTGRGPAELPH